MGDLQRVNSTYARAIACIVISVLILFAFEAGSEKNWTGKSGPLTNYQTLADSFLRGELFLFPAPARILALQDPYDPAGHKEIFESENVWDLSLYKERIYLYFGVTPVVLFFLPFRLLTGSHIPSAIVVYLCCSGALLLAAVTLFRIVEEGKVKKTDRLIGVLPPFLLLGLGSLAGILLKRAYMYEVAVASGMLCSTACLYALIRECREPGRRWRILAGLCAGLAVGSRPNLLPGVVVVLGISLTHVWRHLQGRRRWLAALQLCVPFAVTLAALAAYNWFRFGSVTECGIHYQMGILYAPRTALASWGYFIDNFPRALFGPPALRSNFPWLDIPHEVSTLLSGPADVLMFQRRISLFVGLPFNLFAIYFLVKLLVRQKKKAVVGNCAASLCAPAFILPFAFASTTLVVLSFFLAAGPRYQADYALALVLASSIGWVEFWSDTSWCSTSHIVMRCLALLALGMSLFFGLILTHSVWA